MNVFLLHPQATPDHVGLIPNFLSESDPRPAREQFNERYVWGGWDPMVPNRYHLDQSDGSLHYPGDPPFPPLAMMVLRDEMILIYLHGIVAIVQPDGTFEVDRLD